MRLAIRSVYAGRVDWLLSAIPGRSIRARRLSKVVVDRNEMEKGSPVASVASKLSKDSAQQTSTLGITAKKNENFSEWYQQVVCRSELIEYYDVSGCYILRPWSYHVWSCIQKFMSEKLEEIGVDECYFPTFVTKKRLECEKDHIDGFSPEVAWVTRAGDTELAEPLAIRPTSETIMYPYYANWIRSHRDLPLRLNMWNNVVRWEFKHPQPFIRTREFLWQEGHCAYATLEDAAKEVDIILDIYEQTFRDLLAIPTIPGVKSKNETFAGADYTHTLESFIKETGRGLQASTSHCLGQRFARMFNIIFEDSDMENRHVWQTSWGFSTRSIGLLIMMHSDDKGLVLPPRVAKCQVVVIPVGISSKTENRNEVIEKTEQIAKELLSVKIRSHADTNKNTTPGWKFSYWEMRGVPVRLEIGPKELASNTVTAVLRYNGSQKTINIADLKDSVKMLLDEVHNGMYKSAKEKVYGCIRTEDTWDGFLEKLNGFNMVLSPWCEDPSCEDDVKSKSSVEQSDEKAPVMGAKTLCIPFHLQPKEVTNKNKICFSCGKPAKRYALWGRSY